MLLLFCWYWLAIPAWAEDFTGKVVGVIDGDTIEIMHQGKPERARLDGIDCPESYQALGRRAKQATSQLVFGKEVQVLDKGKDCYGRMISIVQLPASRETLNAALVRTGYAWHYKQYSKDASLARLETEARQAKRGLWADHNPMPPWEFRRNPRGKTQAPTTPASGIAALLTKAKISTPSPSQNETVYVMRTGTKYHRAGCRFLNSLTPMPLTEAAKKYAPCAVCRLSVPRTP